MVKAGKTITDLAPLNRSVTTSTAFFSTAALDLRVRRRTSTGVTGASA